MQSEPQKIAHSQQLAQLYFKELRTDALERHRNQWIVMRSPTEYGFFNDSSMDLVFSTTWSYWDEFGCFCDVVGAETGLHSPKIGMY